MYRSYTKTLLQNAFLKFQKPGNNATLLTSLIWLCLLSACSPQKEEAVPPITTLPLVNIASLSVAEGNSTRTLQVKVNLSTTSAQTVSLLVNSEDGTAKAGEDYEAVVDQFISFAPNSQEQNISITILGDEKFEANESFTLKMSSLNNAYIGQASATITLLTDDENANLTIPTTGATSPLSYPDRSLIWQDEFDTQQNLTDHWTFEIGTGSNGWGNNELQYYLQENTYLYQDHLVIEAREENFGGRAYTSSRMITKDKFDFQYGRVDIRAVLPYGRGIWPAFWMLGDNISTVGWPKCGEIDIMEIIGQEANVLHGTAHWANQAQTHSYVGGSTTLAAGNFSDQFHVFSVIWSEEKIEWLLDDQPYYELAITSDEFSEFHHPFFLIFNIAVGGNWPGHPDASTVFPQYVVVDYIRVFQ